MQLWHGFLQSNETDQNEPKHHYWVQKSGLGAFVSFLARIGSSFWFWPKSVHKCNFGMVFCTVTKLIKTNQNITIGSKKVDWGAFVSFPARIGSSFRFRPESVHKCNFGMVFCTVTKLTKTNQNITIGSKKVDWVRLFRFWPESVVRFGSGPNRSFKCNFGMVFCTVTKLTKTNQNITIGSKKVDSVRSFRFLTESVVRFGSGPNRCINATLAWFFAQ